MQTLHITQNKRQTLIDLLLKSDRRRSHKLVITSCYFNPDWAKQFIDEMSTRASISEICVYIDHREALRLGFKKLAKLRKSLNTKDQLAKVKFVKATTLFHSKAFALVATDHSTGALIAGSLVIGSANLTKSGLTDKGGNIECLLDTQNHKLLAAFADQVANLECCDIDELGTFQNSERDTFAFKYAVLQCGEFVHKWGGDIDQIFAARLRLSAKGKTAVTAESFKARGFVADAATVSKRYFEFDLPAPHLESTENLLRNYGIETHLGHWVPKVPLQSLKNVGEIDAFKRQLVLSFDQQSTAVIERLKSDINALDAEEMIEKVDSATIFEMLVERKEKLLANDSKLWRLFSKFDVFALPYDISEHETIEDLFDEMLESSQQKTRKNVAVKAIIEAYESTDLSVFDDLDAAPGG